MPIYEGLGGLSGDYKLPSVLDIGSAYTKVGISGELAPRSIIKTEVLCRKSNTVRKINSYTDKQDLYDLLVEFVHTIYFKYLLLNPKDKPVIIVESLLCPTQFRETLAGVLFHHYEICSLLVVPSHLVALATLATDIGLVLDVGYEEAVAIPVYCGVPVVHAWQALSLGSRTVFNNVKILLAADNMGVQTISDNVIEDITVRCCFVTSKTRVEKLHNRQPTEANVACPAVLYPLGGSKMLTISGKLREFAYEILYEEDNDHLTLSTMILDALAKVSVDMRVQLAENIVLLGGVTMAPGFKSRLREELRYQIDNVPKYKEMKLATFKFHTLPAKENYAAWLGGAIYGCTEVVGMKALHRDQYFKEKRLPDWVNIRDNRGVS